MQFARTVVAIALLFAVMPALAQPSPKQPRTRTTPGLQRATLLDEDSSNPKGRSYWGSVLWCLNRIKGAGGGNDVEILGKLEIPDRRINVKLSVRRNADASLPASHVIELKFTLPTGFANGGIVQVPGILMKTTEHAKGVAIGALSVKVVDGMFMLGLSNKDRAMNVATLTQQEWFDLPFVYATQRRGILAIEKGPSGRQVFQTAFAAWGDVPGPAGGAPYCSK